VNSEVLNSTSATTYQWYLNGQKIAGAESVNFTPTQNGIYVVRTTDSKGCVFQYSKGFNYTSGSSVFSISGSTSTPIVCAGKTVQITTNVSGENGTTTYNWTSNPAGYTSSSKNIMVMPSVTTTYKVVANNNTSKDSAFIQVNVNPKPNKPIITQSGNLLNSSSGVSYKWFEDTTLIIGAMSSSYSPAKSGAYRAKIIDINGCESDYSDAFSFFLAGISTLNKVNHFELFPNPNNGKFSIVKNGYSEQIEINISDVYGRIVLRTKDTETIDMTEFASGVYFVKIHSDKNLLATIKFNLIK
jgi:hypothetical protein